MSLIEDHFSTDKIPPSPSKRHGKKTSCNRTPYFFDAPSKIKKITVADLTAIPGIDGNTAMKILSEIGTDMSKWPHVKHLHPG